MQHTHQKNWKVLVINCMFEETGWVQFVEGFKYWTEMFEVSNREELKLVECTIT